MNVQFFRHKLLLLLICILTVEVLYAEKSTLFSNTSDSAQLLPAEEAFRLEIKRTEQEFIASWKIADGYYLYREKMEFQSAHGVSAIIPPGEKMHDEFFGDTEIYRYTVDIPFSIRTQTMDSSRLKISYQGCADLGVCYPPETNTIALNTLPQNNSSNITPPISDQFKIADQLAKNTLLLTILIFFMFGVLLAFTPCVLPMIPILSGIIIDNGQQSTKQAFYLSSAYVLALALAYASFGIIVGLTGENIQIWLQKPWIIGLFALVFVILATSMLGLYEFKISSSLQTKLNKLGSKQHGSLIGAFIMGGASALIVGPCVTPALVGALLFITKTGDAIIGGLALFSLGIGMGFPLLIAGTSLGKWMPKPGPAWNMIKVIFSLLLFAVAIWLIDRIVAHVITQILSAILLIISSFYFIKAQYLRLVWKIFSRGAGSIMLLYGVLLVIGATTGGSSFLKPLEHLMQNTNYNSNLTHTLEFKRIKNLNALNSDLQVATQNHQAVMLDFYADWCITCKEMEQLTFTNTEVQQALSNVVKLQVDVTYNTNDDKVLMNQFGIFGPPAILFFNLNGKEIKQARVVGFMEGSDFLQHVRQVLEIR